MPYLMLCARRTRERVCHGGLERDGEYYLNLYFLNFFTVDDIESGHQKLSHSGRFAFPSNHHVSRSRERKRVLNKIILKRVMGLLETRCPCTSIFLETKEV